MKPVDYERQNRVQDILERVTKQGYAEYIERKEAELRQQRKEAKK